MAHWISERNLDLLYASSKRRFDQTTLNVHIIIACAFNEQTVGDLMPYKIMYDFLKCKPNVNVTLFLGVRRSVKLNPMYTSLFPESEIYDEEDYAARHASDTSVSRLVWGNSRSQSLPEGVCIESDVQTVCQNATWSLISAGWLRIAKDYTVLEDRLHNLHKRNSEAQTRLGASNRGTLLSCKFTPHDVQLARSVLRMSKNRKIVAILESSAPSNINKDALLAYAKTRNIFVFWRRKAHRKDELHTEESEHAYITYSFVNPWLIVSISHVYCHQFGVSSTMLGIICKKPQLLIAAKGYSGAAWDKHFFHKCMVKLGIVLPFDAFQVEVFSKWHWKQHNAYDAEHMVECTDPHIVDAVRDKHIDSFGIARLYALLPEIEGYWYGQPRYVSIPDKPYVFVSLNAGRLDDPGAFTFGKFVDAACEDDNLVKKCGFVRNHYFKDDIGLDFITHVDSLPLKVREAREFSHESWHFTDGCQRLLNKANAVRHLRQT